jgi:hypothetical protein
VSAPLAQTLAVPWKAGPRRRRRSLGGARGADHATTITIAESPADFTVRIGIGRWLEHLGVAAIETLLISDLSLVVDVAESAWNIEIEDKLVKDINPRLLLELGERDRRRRDRRPVRRPGCLQHRTP